ncbi:MAG: MerC domain-containing protein [Gammaproteobacteria bacterium]|nr:MerC domain-containing protein [Gammaproteobacteria bacterium]MBT5724548.1 MerC domain-containing protein [Gammaproteobacteria bacterium]
MVLDKASISLSVVCAIHCLLLPLALVLIPSIAVLPIADERFHQLLVVLVLPTSLFALTIGCRRHRQWRVMVCGALGLTVLFLTVLAGHEMLGEFGEKSLTLLGAILVAISHIINFRQCKTTKCKH